MQPDFVFIYRYSSTGSKLSSNSQTFFSFVIQFSRSWILILDLHGSMHVNCVKTPLWICKAYQYQYPYVYDVFMYVCMFLLLYNLVLENKKWKRAVKVTSQSQSTGACNVNVSWILEAVGLSSFLYHSVVLSLNVFY